MDRALNAHEWLKRHLAQEGLAEVVWQVVMKCQAVARPVKRPGQALAVERVLQRCVTKLQEQMSII